MQLKRQIDPFNDALGPERVGKYLQTCLDLFDSGESEGEGEDDGEGLSREEIITRINTLYTEKWGADKLTIENAYEIQQ